MDQKKKTILSDKYIRRFGIMVIAFVLVFLVLFNFENIRGCITGESDNMQVNYEGGNEIIYINGKPYTYKPGIVTELFIGVDKDGKMQSSNTYNNDEQSDFLLLAVINNTEKSYELLHINRDTMTEFSILGVNDQIVQTKTAQIALAHTTGDGMESSCKNTVSAVSNLLFGVNIQHYCSFTISAIPIVNDYVGGVTVTVEDDLTPIDPTLKKGATVKLNGKQAEAFIRSRTGLSDSTNLNRMNRQKVYMSSLVDILKFQAKQDNFVSDLFSKVNEYVLMDGTINETSELLKKLVDYKNNGIISPKGEAVLGKEFMEFYVDEKDLQKTVIDLFLQEVKE